MTVATGDVLRADDGRMRLGWRLLLFVIVAWGVLLVVVTVLPPGILAVSTAMLVGGLVAGWLLLVGDGRRPGALGFHADRIAAAETARGLGLGAALGVVVVAAIALLGGLRWSGQGGTLAGWTVGGLEALLFLAIPAAAEEALLRGYPLQAIAEAWGALTALLITSVTFGALHLANPGVTTIGLLNVTAAGIFLGVVYLKTASLWCATGAHLGWNWSHGYLADVPVSGLELLDAPLYEGAARGPDWLGGGAFGPEGSAVATALVLGAAALCWRGNWLRPGSAALATAPLAFAIEPRALASSGTGARPPHESNQHGANE